MVLWDYLIDTFENTFMDLKIGTLRLPDRYLIEHIQGLKIGILVVTLIDTL